jgi:hypothetical protein
MNEVATVTICRIFEPTWAEDRAPWEHVPRTVPGGREQQCFRTFVVHDKMFDLGIQAASLVRSIGIGVLFGVPNFKGFHGRFVIQG